jgi:hypothetical protein
LAWAYLTGAVCAATAAWAAGRASVTWHTGSGDA